MDFYLKQWGDQHESEQQAASAKIPKLVESHQQQTSPASALPLFVPEPTTPTARLPRMGSCFSVAQWQELELQTLIFKYMLAGAAVPPELLQPIKKSLLHSPSYFLHHPLQHYQHYQPSLFQSGYWGRAAMDPEPGRCRRTDGKKWRCSRDVVPGQKYCERHVHRGRNRSRKPVEIPTANGGGTLKQNGPVTSRHFSISGSSSSADLFHLNQSYAEAKDEDKSLFKSHNVVDHRSSDNILKPFLDDWHRSLETDSNSATSLSISMPGNSSSDVSLKLATGRADKREQHQVSWTTGWETNPTVAASMGGPLAEALRSSSTTNASPDSVLHDLPQSSAQEVSFFSS